MKTITTVKKEYQAFIENIPNLISKVKSQLGKETLDYSLEEIDAFEEMYRGNMKNPEAIGESEESFDQMFTAYIGTAFLWHFGGEWGLDKSKSSSCYGEPYVVNFLGDYVLSNSVFPVGWTFLFKTDQFDETLSVYFKRQINYYSKKPEATLEPVRNIF